MASDLRERKKCPGCRFPSHPAADGRSEGSKPMTAPSLSELSSLLQREREILDRLVAVLSDGADGAETEGLLRSVSSLELHRAITAREVAADLGLNGEPTLSDLV